MKRSLWAGVLCSLGLLPGCATQHDEAGQHARLLQRRVTHDVRLPYLLFLPREFAATGSQRYPLLIDRFGHDALRGDGRMTRVTPATGLPRVDREPRRCSSRIGAAGAASVHRHARGPP